MAAKAVDTVELTVRCAFQASKDIRVMCPVDWTIRQLKEHLHQVCPSHPAVTSQRLIFSGTCLTDDMIMKDVMDQRKVVDGPQVLHLVCPLPQSSPPVLRQRHSGDTANSSNTSGMSAAAVQPSISSPTWSSNYYEWYRQYYGAAAPENMARLHHYSGFYAAYMNQWQEYHNYMMGHMGYSAFLSQGLGSNGISRQSLNVPDGQEHDAAAANQDINVDAAAQQIPAEANVAAAVPGGGRDFLDIVYRVFRVMLFLSAVLLYSSIERFLAVITVALFIFFIQLRRNQQRQARVVEVVEPNVNNNNAGEQSRDGTQNAQSTFVAPAPPSAFQVFCATCYSFVTSFFTSLVPDHPVPVDLN